MQHLTKVEQAQQTLADFNIHGPAGFVTCTDPEHEDAPENLVIQVVLGYNPPFATASVVCGQWISTGVAQQEGGDYDPVEASKRALWMACYNPTTGRDVPNPLTPQQLQHVYAVYVYNMDEEIATREQGQRLNEMLSQLLGGAMGLGNDQETEGDSADQLLSGRDAFADMIGRKQARLGAQWPEENCPNCENVSDCPIVAAFQAEQLVMEAEKKAGSQPGTTPE